MVGGRRGDDVALGGVLGGDAGAGAGDWGVGLVGGWLWVGVVGWEYRGGLLGWNIE